MKAFHVKPKTPRQNHSFDWVLIYNSGESSTERIPIRISKWILKLFKKKKKRSGSRMSAMSPMALVMLDDLFLYLRRWHCIQWMKWMKSHSIFSILSSKFTEMKGVYLFPSIPIDFTISIDDNPNSMNFIFISSLTACSRNDLQLVMIYDRLHKFLPPIDEDLFY